MKQYLRFLALLCLFLRVVVSRNSLKGISVLVLVFMLSGPLCVAAQDAVTVKGTVVSQPDGEPLAGVNIIVKSTTRGVITDGNGTFEIVADAEDVLVFSFIGYRTQEVAVSGRTEFSVELIEDAEMLGEVTVYSTGYQELPAERATGSFEHLDEELINRSVSTDVISRLEGVTGSLLFQHGSSSRVPGETAPKLRIRGMSTMYGSLYSGTVSDKDLPLIIVDNFPFEGNLSSINPNDVESITILKDAAAASIWGARAGNGVIVINTKSGDYGSPMKISINSNVTVVKQPDLSESPYFMDPAHFIDAEQQFFTRNYYNSDENSGAYPMISPAVEIMIRERDGLLTSAEANAALGDLADNDVRADINKYLYRKAVNQQYSVNLSGGSGSLKYYFSGGYDRNSDNVVGANENRYTFNTRNTLKAHEKLNIHFGMYYSDQQRENNGLNVFGLKHYTKHILPYARLADERGEALPITYQYREQFIANVEEEGLLDWRYRPLDEMDLRDDEFRINDTRFSTAIDYAIVDGLHLILNYQGQYARNSRELLIDKDSYHVRNLVNQFTQSDGERIFPHGAILRKEERTTRSQNGRAQLSYDGMILDKHNLSVLLGGEVREVVDEGYSSEVYGFDPDVLTYASLLNYTTYYPTRPRYSGRIQSPYSDILKYTDRFLSYYANASYTYDRRYILSGSARRDASNLFGVKTNQKSVPLWSTGVAWDVSNEGFYTSGMFQFLRLRATYGVSGNVDKSATAFTTANYGTDYFTGLPIANISSPGNPELRWEKVKMLNAAIDFRTTGNKLSGKIEYYRKRSEDLLAPVSLDPTTGFNNTYVTNYATLLTKGIDIDLRAVSHLGQIRWEINGLFNYVADEVLDFTWEGNGSRSSFLSNSSLPQVGEPLYMMYSIPWSGLDPDTGDPLVMHEGQLGTEYSRYLSQLDSAHEFVSHGPKLPPYFGAVRNTFTWKDISIGFNITWKAGYYVRRSALSYYSLYSQWLGNNEYADRWQQAGDITQVPSVPTGGIRSVRDQVYTESELTVEKGDHIRFQDINVSYTLANSVAEKLSLGSLRIYFYAANLGIIWKASEKILDPDYPSTYYPLQKRYSIGLQATF